jgi:hypothetical protein
VHIQLGRNRSYRPALGVVVAQDLRCQIRGNGHVNRHSLRFASVGDESDNPKSPGAQKRIPNDHRSGTGSSALRRLAGLLLRLVGVHQHRAVVVYPDASRFVGAPAIALGAWRGHDGLCGCSGSADRQHVGHNFWLGANNRRCNSADPGRSGCRWLQCCGSGRTERAWAAAEWLAWAFMPMRETKLWTATLAS